MTKAAAIHKFWSSFGLKAYEENSVPDDAVYPRIVYQYQGGSFGSVVGLIARLYYKSNTNVDINAKAEEIKAFISRGGYDLPCDGGAIHIDFAEPFPQPLDTGEPVIKGKLLTISVQFWTAT